MQEYIAAAPMMMQIQFIHIPTPMENTSEPEAPSMQAVNTWRSIFWPLSLNPGSRSLSALSRQVKRDTETVSTSETATPQTTGKGSFMLMAATAIMPPDIIPERQPFFVAFFQNMQLIRGKNIAEE